MNSLRRCFFAVASAAFFIVCSPAMAQWQVPDHSVPIGRGAGTGFKNAAPGTAGQALVSNGASSDPSFQAITGGAFGAQSANTVFSGPTSGAAASPAFRALVGADLPNPSGSTLGGVQSITCSGSQWINTISTSGVPACAQPGYSNLSGTVSTAIDALTGCNVQGGILYRNGSLWVCLAPGTSGQVLQSGGPGANPSWLTVTGTGTVTNITAGTDITLSSGANCTTTCTINVGSGVTRTIASGAKALATGAISSGACTSAQTDTATGTLTTDTIIVTFNGDPTAVTGYAPVTAGGLTIYPYPTADTVNFKVCNPTVGSITPGAVTLNWRVVR